ncbi:MAG: hypothetical protein M5R40_19445 [Anaerolineae bacterium]|nr:hypothetical protein [Anaerolineae bacterium]
MELALRNTPTRLSCACGSEPSVGRPEWRGWIRHVQTGEKLFFRDPKTILPFLLRFLEAVSSQTEPQPERLRELWRSLSERLLSERPGDAGQEAQG